MNSYHNKVISLAGEKQKGEVPLVVNLFQSVLDGFIRAEIKKEEAEPTKVKVNACPLPSRLGLLKVYIQRSEWELSSTSKGPK